ncbi:MAG: ferrous iron transport protein B [Candidatus Lokiarchaeota archaeon]|nr:ferrous iron transport protein B [Candidatus Lokiarchaeota archaeon]
MSSHTPKQKNFNEEKRTINIALAGNPNVGKSVIFNQLTGLSQTIGNWPGKTVERMEGYLEFLGYHFNIVDLPGIYSLSTYTLEEIVSREYIVSEDVDIIINVIDVTNLDRNLFLTFQLIELGVPLILAFNQMDILRKRNRDLDFQKIEKLIHLPALPVVAVHGTGVHELLEKAIEMLVAKDSKSKSKTDPNIKSLTSFGKEIEEKIDILVKDLEKNYDPREKSPYPKRFLAIKLLENDEEIYDLVNNNQETNFLSNVEVQRNALEDLHGEDITTIISSEIYTNIQSLTDKIIINKPIKKKKVKNYADIFDHLTTHSIWGYVILIMVLLGIYLFTFSVGDFLGGLIDELFTAWSEQIYLNYNEDNILVNIFWDGGFGGLIGAIGGVLVYVIPFFITIEILQDSGYLPRAAFLMDRAMHAMGVHGKTVITMVLGFGCNVPACAGCRIMETEREKKISIALTSLVPCAAVMTVVLGLVGRHVGLEWVLILFLINFLVIFLVGRILNKTMPGTCTELIMEMHAYRTPNYKVIFKQTWIRTKEFVYKALPIIIILGIVLEILFILNLLEPVNFILSPITVIWLGLPALTGVFLIYGILRKELTLVLLAILAENLGLTIAQLLSPIQMITFSLVSMLYVPCFATIIIIAKQTNWKYALQISILEISIALLIGGIVNFSFFLFVIF